jgi:hypothetical protein
MEAITKHILLEERKSINGLEISESLGCMNWQEAIEACKKLGRGWRLPIKDELDMFYENREEIGGFANIYYWSSSEYDNSDAWVQGFSKGFLFANNKTNSYCVRAVRAS